jgi:orotidine-5'-phosphate decarboxylase
MSGVNAFTGPMKTEPWSGLCLGVAPSDSWLHRWRLPPGLPGAREFCASVLDAAGELVGVYKAQVPFFLRFGPAGMDLLRDFVDRAHGLGAKVILDAKVGDAGDTMDALADTYLGPGSVLGGDAVTAAATLGPESLDPLLTRAKQRGCLVFVVVRTSNHAASGTQCAVRSDGRTVAEFLADEVTAWNTRHAPGEVGPAAALVGARPPESTDLVARLSTSVIELPGLGRPDRHISEVLAPARTAPGRVAATVTTGVLRHGPDIPAVRDSIMSWQRGIAQETSTEEIGTEEIGRGATV